MKIEKVNSGLSQQNLIADLKNIINQSKRDNTKKSYLASLRKFQNFLTKNKIEAGTGIEKNTLSILLFLTEEAKTKKYNTVKLYYAGVKSYCMEKNIPVEHNKIKIFFKGLKNEKNASSGALALEFSELKEIIQSINTKKLIGKRDKAILLLGFFGAFRRSELVKLNIQDIKETSRGLSILVLNSKTDKEKIGMYKAIPFNFQDNFICPVQALRDYLNEAKIKDGAVLRSVRKNGTVGNRLSDIDVYRIVKKYAFNFSAHSLRVGFVTTASENGANPQSIMLQTGHKTVQMIAHYTRSKDAWKNNAIDKIY